MKIIIPVIHNVSSTSVDDIFNSIFVRPKDLVSGVKVRAIKDDTQPSSSEYHAGWIGVIIDENPFPGCVKVQFDGHAALVPFGSLELFSPTSTYDKVNDLLHRN